jgi:hypothetical protein
MRRIRSRPHGPPLGPATPEKIVPLGPRRGRAVREAAF